MRICQYLPIVIFYTDQAHLSFSIKRVVLVFMKKILIIDDNRDVRENTAELLELNHFEVFTADTGHRGYEAAKKHLPDIIMCDIIISGINENDFLSRSMAHQLIKNIPFIFFSNGSTDTSLQKYFPNSNQKYLKKPFAEEDLMQAVNNILHNYSDNLDIQR